MISPRIGAWATRIRRGISARLHYGTAVGEPAFAAVLVAACLSAVSIGSSPGGALASGAERLVRWIVAGAVPGVLFRTGRALVETSSFVSWGLVLVMGWIALSELRPVHVLRQAVVAVVVFVFTLSISLLAVLQVRGLVWALLAVLVGAIGVHASAWRRPSRLPLAHRIRRAIGPSVGVACGLCIAITWFVQVRGASLLTERAVCAIESPAYDVTVAGDPSVLLFSDQRALYRVFSPYGGGRAPEPLVVVPYAERLIRSHERDVVYLATSARGVRRISLSSPVSVTVFEAEASAWAASLAEDPIGRQLIVLNEWSGTGTVFALDGGEPRDIDLSDGTWTVPWITVDAPSRRAFVTSMLGDGDVLVLDLDTLTVRSRRPDLFVYHSAIDRERGLLWATRPVTGELVALDLETLDVRERVPVASGPRDVAIDPVRGQVFVNTYPFGYVFRVDVATGRVLEVGGCGWRCRHIHIDPQQRTLWAASLTGIHRFALDEPLSSDLR